MPLIDWTPGTREGRAALSPFFDAREPIGLPGVEPEPQEQPVSFGEAFSATFEREHTVLSLMDEIDARIDNDQHRATTADWNPYQYINQNWTPDQISEFGSLISDGMFDDVVNPHQLERRAQELAEERRLIEQMQGNTAGMLLGGLAAGLLDPVSYIPIFGAIQKGTRFIRLARLAATVAAQTAASEAILQSTQDLRTATESFLNIGTSTALGAGLGLGAIALTKGSTLHPRHPENPLRIDVEDTPMLRDLDGDIHSLPSESTVGAAEAGRGPMVREGADLLLGRADGDKRPSFLTRLFLGRTPNGRMMLRRSAEARSLGLRMSGGAGYTRGHVEGLSAGRHAEEEMNLYMQETYGHVVNEGMVIKQEIDQALGELGHKRVSSEDFHGATRRIGHNTLDDTFVREMQAKYGRDGWEKIHAGASRYAETIHDRNAYMEGELVKIGALRDEIRLVELRGQIQKFDEAIAALKEQRKAVRESRAKGLQGEERAAEGARIDQELAKLDEAEAQLRQDTNIDELRAARDRERAKPEALGRDYFSAQLWDKSAIIHHREEFRDFLIDVLSRKPDEHWLFTQHGLDPDEFAALATTNPERHKEIMREWIGDEWYVNISRLEHQLDAARHIDEQTELDLNDLLREDKLLTREQGQVNLSQARKFRDRYHASVDAARQRVVALQAEMRAIAEAATAARQISLDRQLELTPPGRKPRPSPEMTRELAAQRSRAQTVAAQLKREEARLSRLYKALDRYDNALERANFRKAEVETKRQMLDAAIRQAKQIRGIAASDLKGLKKALLKGRSRAGMDTVIDEVIENMAKDGSFPGGLLDDIAGVTGRVKERRLRLTPDQRQRAEVKFEDGSSFLRTDLPSILESQYRSLSGHLGLQNGMNIRSDGTGSFKSWGSDDDLTGDSVLGAIRRSYQQLIDDAKTPSERASLHSEMNDAIADMNHLKDALLGQVNIGTKRDGWAAFLSRNVRRANLQRYGGTFLISSMTDIATIAMRHKFLPELRKHIPEALSVMSGASHSELRVLTMGTEIAQGALHALKRVGDDDLLTMGGVGVMGSRTQAITRGIDRAMEFGVDKVTRLSGLPIWNRFWKTLSGIAMSYRLRDLVGNYDGLSRLEVTDLASLGIGRTEAGRIHRMIQKYGDVDEAGRWDPHLDRWLETREGFEASRDFRAAIMRDMNRSIITPGLGDTPRLMSNWMGRMLLQFQSFAFASMNSFLLPMVQRGAHFGDLRIITVLSLLAASSAIVVAAKDMTRGEDPLARYTEDRIVPTAHELIDRSGMLTFFAPYIATGLNLVNSTSQGASRYRRANNVMPLLGPVGGLATDFNDLVTTLVAGSRGNEETEEILKKAARLAPLYSLMRALYNVGDFEATFDF